MSISKTKLLKANNLPDIHTLINTLELTDEQERNDIYSFKELLSHLQLDLANANPKFQFYKKELSARINQIKNEVEIL